MTDGTENRKRDDGCNVSIHGVRGREYVHEGGGDFQFMVRYESHACETAEMKWENDNV